MTLTPLDINEVTAHLRPPELAELAGKARRRTRRRRVTGAAAVLATAAVAATLIWPGGASDEAEPPADRPTETYSGPVPSPIVHRQTIALSPETAVAIGPAGCVMTVRFTTDAGRTWSKAGGPPPVDPCNELPYEPVTVVDAHTYRLVVAGRGWFTTDAGRTWTPEPEQRRVARFGPGQPSVPLECHPDNECDRPQAVDGATGGLQTLVTMPFARQRVAVWADTDTLWTVDRGEAPRAAYSNDRGRTWSKPFDLPVPGPEPGIHAFGPRRAYVHTSAGEDGTSVYRTDNGGKTWTKLTMPTRETVLFTETATGTLIVAEPGWRTIRTWVSTDHGATFTESAAIPEPPKPMSGGDANGLISLQDGNGVTHVFDGEKWSEIQPPPTQG